MTATLKHNGTQFETNTSPKNWTECIEYAQVTTAELTPHERMSWDLEIDGQPVPHRDWV